VPDDKVSVLLAQIGPLLDIPATLGRLLTVTDVVYTLEQVVTEFDAVNEYTPEAASVAGATEADAVEPPEVIDTGPDQE
jgi:hypothetical protein